MNSILTRWLIVVVLFLLSAASPYITASTGVVANYPDRNPFWAALLVTLAGVAWLALAWSGIRALGVVGAYLSSAAAVVALAVATAIGAADCFHDACPVLFDLFWVLVLGYPLAVLLLALGFKNNVTLPLGYLALTLPYAVVMFFAGAMMPSVQRLLAAIAPYALLYAIHRLMIVQLGSPQRANKYNHRPLHASLIRFLLKLAGFFLIASIPAAYALQQLHLDYLTQMTYTTILLLVPTITSAVIALGLVEKRHQAPD